MTIIAEVVCHKIIHLFIHPIRKNKKILFVKSAKKMLFIENLRATGLNVEP